MADPWLQWVEQTVRAIEDEHPMVQVLRARIEGGERVVRINTMALFWSQPRYALVLAREHTLDMMTVDHCASFTRWSLESAARLERPEEEAARIGVLMREHLEELKSDHGRGFLRAILFAWIQEVQPPRTLKFLAGEQENPPSANSTGVKAAAALRSAMEELVSALGQRLRYSSRETADILDLALQAYFDAEFHITERRTMFPR